MKPIQNLSFDGGARTIGRVGTEDEETEEVTVPKVTRLTESTCPSPYLWRRDMSTLSSFASQIPPSDEDLTARPYPRRPTPEVHPEKEIERIKQESEEAKDYLREFARNLHARADEVRSNSAMSVCESRAMRGYLGKLGNKLDKLLEEAEETEKRLEEFMKEPNWLQRGENPFPRSSTLQNQSSETSFELRLQQLEQTTASLLRSNHCRMEGAESGKTRVACCTFLGF